MCLPEDMGRDAQGSILHSSAKEDSPDAQLPMAAGRASEPLLSHRGDETDV